MTVLGQATIVNIAIHHCHWHNLRMQAPATITHPTWFEWITFLAILLGPIFALFAQRILDKLRDKRKAKENVFFSIMQHRAQWYHVERIQALNSIDVVFADEEKVLSKWKSFVEQTSVPRPEDEQRAAAWDARMDTAVCDLYQAIGESLGYHLDLKRIKEGAYTPQLHADFNEAQVLAMKGLAKAVRNGELKVVVREAEAQGERGTGL